MGSPEPRCARCNDAEDAGVHDTAETCEAVRGPCLDPARHHPFAAAPSPVTEGAEGAGLREALVEALLPEFREPGPGSDMPWSARQKAEQAAERIEPRLRAALAASPSADEPGPDLSGQLLDELIAKVEDLASVVREVEEGSERRLIMRSQVLAILTAAKDGQPTTDL